MEKRNKRIIAILVCLLLVSAATIAYLSILVTQRFDTTGVLSVPTELDVNMTQWDWGTFNLTGETVNSSQGISFKNLGAIPLELASIPDIAIPEWFNGECWSLSWTGEGYVLQPLETIDTIFTLMVSVQPTKDYMIAHQIPELTFTLGIDVTGSKVFRYFLTITTTIGGTTDPVPGVYNYTAGTNIDIWSIPDTDYDLVAWVINGQNFDPKAGVRICMNQSYTVEAQFYPPGLAYELTIIAGEGGTTDPTPGIYAYPAETVVTVTAIPDSGYGFERWELDVVNRTENPIIVTMNMHHRLEAYFEGATIVFVDPEHNSFAVGETFTITVIVANVEGLYGIDLRFSWDTSILEYVSHTAKIPVEDFVDGILYEPGFFTKDDEDVVAGTYWVAYACMDPAPTFNGTGIAFEITFNVLGIGSCPLDITASSLSDKLGDPIEHTVHVGYFDNTT